MGFTVKRVLLAALLLPGAVMAQLPPKLTINEKQTYQTIQNFGASDAWACQFTGAWPEAKRGQMADWLFSMDTTASGQPKGIGLSMWRFNLGAGSAQQGDESGIKDEWRRAESFLEKDGSYNFDRQAAQQWFLTAAKQRGVPYFLAFFNSPPVEFTKNKKAFSDKGKCNIDSLQYKAFATYTADAIKGMQRKTGILFQYISPVNEPQWDWMDGGQEGNPYWNHEIRGVVGALSAALQKQKLKTKIILPESGHIKYLLEEGDKPGRGNQVNDLMRPGGANYVGDLPLVEKVVAAHSYFSTSPYPASIKLREQVAARVAEVKGLSFWQSEYCILGDNDGEISGNRKDTGIKAALYVARTIHTDLAVANATAWQWWIAISPYNYKDGLIYIDKNKTDGRVEDSKMLWALGNYSRFVRPGMQRVGVTIPGSPLLVSAWKKGMKMVVVIVNTGANAETIDAGDTPVQTYTTSNSQALAKGTAAGITTIPPESIVTLVL